MKFLNTNLREADRSLWSTTIVIFLCCALSNDYILTVHMQANRFPSTEHQIFPVNDNHKPQRISMQAVQKIQSSISNRSGGHQMELTKPKLSLAQVPPWANFDSIRQISARQQTEFTNQKPVAPSPTLPSDDDMILPPPVLERNTSIQISSSVDRQEKLIHPLLIYSVRYEIRGYDLNFDSSTSGSNFMMRQSLNVDQHMAQQTAKPSRTLIAGLKNTIGLDFLYNNTETYIYWTDVIEERIYRGTFINNVISNVETIIQSGLSTAEGLAVDWVGRHLYWVESTLDHIEVANINGSSRRTLIAGDMESPRAIVLDPRFGLLFWSDWDKRSPRIERATMSGDDRKTIIQIKDINGGWPNGLTIDYDSFEIYWADANSDSIHCVDYDGNNHRTVLQNHKSLGHPFSITLFRNSLYWTDWKTNSIATANKVNGTDVRELHRLPTRLFDIKVLHPSRQPKVNGKQNPCWINNGNCSHLCLLSIDHSRKCECPHLMKLSNDGLTCEVHEQVLLIGRMNEIRAVDKDKPMHHVMAPISVPKVYNPRQLEFDAKTKTIYWVDSQTNDVKKTMIGGTNIETVLEVIIESPRGLALDWISRNIYVTSPQQNKTPGKIFISNLNGEYISLLMNESHGIVSPKSIAVHPTLGLLFCVDETPTGQPIIFMADMDGGNKSIIASKSNDGRLESPTSLAIDYESNHVYWINIANVPSGKNSIQYYDISSREIVTVIDEREKINPGILCIDGDQLIISGLMPPEVLFQVSLSDRSRHPVSLKVQNLDQISALRVYNSTAQGGKNACSLQNGGCSQLCVPKRHMGRSCKCTMGYVVDPNDDTKCVGRDEFIIFSYNLGMKGVSMQANSSQDDYYLPHMQRASRASSIDYLYRDDWIYWVDNEEGSITRINRDTTNHQVIVQGFEADVSISIDWVAENIYWLDTYYDVIEVAFLDGTNRTVIVSGDMDKANGIVVNPIRGYLVWSDIGTQPRIETARLDGSNRRVIVMESLSRVDDLTIDFADNYIYWIDSTSAVVERVREDGQGRQKVHSSPSNQGAHIHPVSIAIHKSYLYIADSVQQNGSISRCDKNDCITKAVIQQNLGDGVRDIVVFADQPTPKPTDNPCGKNRGDCESLCIFMGEKAKRRCLCAHGKLGEDGKSCKPYDTFVVYSKLTQIDSLAIKDDEPYGNPPYPSINVESRSNVISLAVDHKLRRIIYSDIGRNQICSIAFNGTDRRILVKDQSLVEGIAYADDQLFWTSISDNTISRFNTSSSCAGSTNCTDYSVEKLIKLGPDDKPRGIAYDRCTSYIYWTNWNNNASIQRAGPVNEYKVESIVTTHIKIPNGIAIDNALRKLYWCDARLDKIEVCDMDGSNRVVLIAALPQHPFALAIWDNYVFWTDWLAKGVFKADKYTGQDPKQIKKLQSRPMGIAVAAPEDSKCPAECAIACEAGYTCVSMPGQLARCEPQHVWRPSRVHHLGCKHWSNSGCEYSSYREIIRDNFERYHDGLYNMTDVVKPTMVPIPDTTPKMGLGSVTSSTTETIVKPTELPIPISNISDPLRHNDELAKFGQNTTSLNPLPAIPVVTIQPSVNSSTVHEGVSATSSYPISVETTTSAQTPLVMNSTKENSTKRPTTESPRSIAVSSSISVSPVPSALKPTTDSLNGNECVSDSLDVSDLDKTPQFKCYLSDKPICIPRVKHCDGNYDCPKREDENECYLYKRGSYSPKRDSNWHRFVTVILIIFGAAVAALLLVFGGKSRRLWFMGNNGGFGHRRMFDESGTNIEISNPMFDDDETSNLSHCAFSIDLNERTTNFSNPLYERQVLLMTEKRSTPKANNQS